MRGTSDGPCTKDNIKKGEVWLVFIIPPSATFPLIRFTQILLSHMTLASTLLSVRSQPPRLTVELPASTSSDIDISTRSVSFL